MTVMEALVSGHVFEISTEGDVSLQAPQEEKKIEPVQPKVDPINEEKSSNNEDDGWNWDDSF